MAPTFKPQCCDSDFYLMLGQACADNFEWCWHGLRPMGAQFYFSLPFRLGLEKEWVIPLNGVVMLLSALASFPAVRALLPTVPRLTRIFLAAAFLGAHVFFLAGQVRNSLSDLPASVAALMSIWAIVLAAVRGKGWFYAAAGAALGLSAMIRAFFLYPSLVCAAAVLLVTFWRKETRRNGLLFIGAFAIPVLFQVFYTHKFTHHWAFIDPESTAYGQALHFETITYGYDTLLPAVGHRYDAPNCFAKGLGMADAVRKHAWGEALCLIAYRQWFYFGSYTSYGEVYLPAATDRHFSVPFLLVNVAAILAAAAWVLHHARRRPLIAAIFVFLGAIWGQGGAIIPEGRFMVAFCIAAWILAVGGLTEFALHWRRLWPSLQHLRKRLRWTRKQNEIPAGGT